LAVVVVSVALAVVVADVVVIEDVTTPPVDNVARLDVIVEENEAALGESYYN
jgi:hypothetical protein